MANSFRSTLLVLLVAITFSASAFENRNLLQKRADINKLSEILFRKQQWVSYPAYNNRNAWWNLMGNLQEVIIKEGEANLNYSWKAITASQYLEYERSGSRTVMEGPYGANAKALGALVYAELAEGKGRFMEQIINGVWYYCDMPSWVLSAHLPVQKSHRNLPDFNEQIIDLGSGDTGSFLAWTYYFFHNEFDKVNPIISLRLEKSIRERILDPYLQRNDYWWQGFNYKKGDIINNWNPWVNANVMLCYLLVSQNENTMLEGVYKTMQSTDQFINYVKSDGACEEGPSYWDHAAGKLYDYLEILNRATSGKLNLFDEPLIKKMGEYIVNCNVGNGWTVNFADASAKASTSPLLIYRYGNAVQSDLMKQFSVNSFNVAKTDLSFSVARDFFRSIENLKSLKVLATLTDSISKSNSVISTAAIGNNWYSETEFLFSRTSGGLFLAAKAGFNNESHNHNDVGTFSLYVDAVPFIVDAGVGTYTRQTFGKERYTIWTMQSNYHNVPMINGKPQSFGIDFKASGVSFNEISRLLSMNIAGAYDSSANIKYWIRNLSLANTQLSIEEKFSLIAANDFNSFNFLTWPKPVLLGNGQISLEKEGKKIILLYDEKNFTASVEEILQTDKKLSSVWGDSLYRITLKANKKQVLGKYKFSFKRV